MKKELLAIIRTVAPSIATAFGGPLAGIAARALSETLLGKPDGSMKDIETALLGASSETMLKLKEADQTFAIRMKELDIDLDRINADDRDSARKREVASKSVTTTVLAYVLMVGGLGIAGMILFTSVSKTDSVLAGTIIGYILGEMKQVTTYYFGSSKGSADKNKTIEGLMGR